MTFGAAPYGSTPFGAAPGTTTTSGISSTRFGIPTTSLVATGFTGTAFGTANVRPIAVGFLTANVGADVRLVQPGAATGIYSTVFGTGVAPPHVMPIYSTQYGTPNSPYLQTGTATGIGPGAFGAPRLGGTYLHFAATPSTAFSLAYTSFAQTAQAIGFTAGGIGNAQAFQPFIVTNVAAAALGFSGTQFGLASSPYAQTAAGYGFDTTGFGFPSSTTAGPTSRFGVPTADMVLGTSGWASTTFGVPFIGYLANTTAPATQFGTPTAKANYVVTGFQTGKVATPASFLFGRKAFGFRSTRIGQPRGQQRINRQAAGWTSTALGTPLSVERHRAFHIPPTAKFGTPLLTRAPLC